MRLKIFLIVVNVGLAACVSATPAQGPLRVASLLPMPSDTPTPAVTPLLPTPEAPPTYTPTPTSTPVTYLVKKGDTLGGIAYSYGISVEVLQAANPGVLPAFLSIGTVLTIPVVADSGVSNIVVAAATPTPLPVTFAGGPACYPLATGALYCLVEVQNPGAAPLQNVAAQIALIGPQGEVLASEVGFAALDLLLPGNGSPLAVLFPGMPPAMVAPVAQVISAEPAGGGVAPTVPLDISAPQLVPPSSVTAGALWTATGTVRNGTGAAVTSVRLVLTLYDAQKRIVGYRQQEWSNGLAAGTSQEFSISAASLGGGAEGFAVAAEGKP